MDALRWVGVDLLSGQIVADLPNVELTSEAAVTIGAYESASVNLTITDETNPSWEEATQEGGSALIAYTGTPDAPVIVYGGIVQQRARPIGTSTVNLALVTPEGYLDGCPVGTYSATDVNQDTILADLVGFATSTNRLPITLIHVAPSTQAQSVSYTSASQTSVYTALQQLSSVSGGPEWTMGWHWDLAAATIVPTLTYGSRIGAAPADGLEPAVTIESADLMPGSVFTEDYSPGQGANQVIAYGGASTTASSDDVPLAVATAIDLQGRPLWTFGYSPNQSVTDPVILGTYAAAAVSQMEDGGQPLTMVLPVNAPGKRLGVDWNLGDDLGWSLTGPTFPSPVSGTSRCIGYRLSLDKVTPILKRATT